jgi:general secretion pathway protein L
MRSVGIDVGTSSIKVVEATMNNKGQLTLTRFLEHPIDTNPAFDPELQILEFIKSLSQEYNPRDTRFIFGLKQEKVSIRAKTFPFADRLKITRSLPIELEDDLPFASENAIYDAKIVRFQGQGAQVLATATPKSRVEEIIRRFGDSGLDVAVVSCDGLALANCYENWLEAPPTIPEAPEVTEDSPKKLLQLILYIGHTSTLIHTIEDGRLIGVRSILWGGKLVAEAVARKYEIPLADAYKEVQTKAFILPNKVGASYDQIVFSDTIAYQYRDLMRDLKISILEIQAEHHGIISSVEISGGASQVQNLSAYLTSQLEVAVNVRNLLHGFTTNNIEIGPRVECLAGVAVGLALEGLKKPRNPAIQFLRDEFARENTYFKVLWQQWGVAVQFFVAFYISFFIYSGIRDGITASLAERANDALKKQAQNVAHLPKKQSGETAVSKYIREQKKRAKEIRTLSNMAKMNSVLDVLRQISDSSPVKNSVTLNVRRLSIQDDFVTMEAFLNNNQEISMLQKALMGIAVNGHLEPRAPTIAAPAGTTAYAIGFRVDRGVK